MSKKVGILTLYYKNANYGGILQAFALQKTLDSMGMESKQISYKLESGYPESWKKYLINTVKTIIKVLIRQDWHKRHTAYRKKIYAFADMIPHTKVVSNRNLPKISDDFDWFIVGSDQVWNPMGWQPALFLDFLPDEKPRMSYAASMARDALSTDELLFVKKYIDKFSYISVRESETAKIFKDICPNRSVEVMPDPAMLLTADEWYEVICDRPIDAPYVFAYCLGFDFEKRNKIIKDAEQKGYKVVFVPYMDKRSYEWDCRHSSYTMEEIGIPEFLSLIKYAEYVVTDSFHGTVFSLIFHTPFYSFHRFKSGEKGSMNSRISTLLEKFELSDRFGDDVPSEIKNVDWEKVDGVLDMMRETGRKYLLDCILMRG